MKTIKRISKLLLSSRECYPSFVGIINFHNDQNSYPTIFFHVSKKAGPEFFSVHFTYAPIRLAERIDW
jgi:hypothetical protein